jgi:drug/metabolite transporter (DMT)-like permease
VSTSAPLIREAAAPALAIAFWRNALALVAILPFAATRHRVEVQRLTGRERRLAVTAGFFLAAHFATWVPSLSYTTVASSVALVATQPVWAAVLARARGEDVSPRAWTGIALAVTGTVVLSGVDFHVSSRALLGDALALAGGIFAAAYVTVGADVRRTVSTTVYTSLCYSTAAIALMLLCLAGGKPLTGYSGTTWLCLIGMAVGPQLLGHTLVNRVLRTISPTQVSVAILFEIVGASVLAWMFFDESPPVGAYPAAAMIGVGVVLVLRAGRTPAVPGMAAID